MARKLKVELDFETARANRKAREANREVQKVGKTGQRAGAEIGQGMGVAGRMTANLTGQIVALGASYISLAALQRAIQGVASAYKEALTLRAQFVSTAATANRAVAGAAAQFGVGEDAMRQLIGRIGGGAGAGAQDIGGLTNLLTAAASTGLISGIRPTAAGGVSIPQTEQDTLVLMEQFIQRTGAFGQETDLSKLVARGLGGAPSTRQNVGRVLGQLGTAFRQSELSGWGEFMRGGISGISGLTAQGVGFERALSSYAALAKMVPTGMRAGEIQRMVGERFFTAVDPKMVRQYERAYGPGSYWRDKQQSPDLLYANIMDMLLGAQGPAGAKLWAGLGIAPEQAGRLTMMGDVRGTQQQIMAAMRGATGAATIGDLETWRVGDRAVTQAGGLAVLASEAAAGEGMADVDAYRNLAIQKRKELRRKHWLSQSLFEMGATENYELSVALTRALHAQAGTEYGAGYFGSPTFDFTGDELTWSPQRQGEQYDQRIRAGLQSLMLQTNTPRVNVTNVGTQYTNTPTEAANTTLQRGQ